MVTYLPNGDRAIVDIRKLADYCLNPSHPRGRHKARVFRQAAGLQQDDAAWLPWQSPPSRGEPIGGLT